MTGSLVAGCAPVAQYRRCSVCCAALGLRPFSAGRALTQGAIATAPRRSRRQVTAQALFGFLKKPKAAEKVVRETVEPSPSYNLPLALLGIAALSAYADNKVAAGLTGILGAFLAIQALRVRFRFEDDALEVLLGDSDAKTENKFVGGENRWKYDTFTNWEFWWPNFPVLVYFKETQTKPEGQIHFFPIIFNGKQLYDVMAERCGTSQNSGKQ